VADLARMCTQVKKAKGICEHDVRMSLRVGVTRLHCRRFSEIRADNWSQSYVVSLHAIYKTRGKWGLTSEARKSISELRWRERSKVQRY